MDIQIPTINLPPPYSNEMSAVSSSRQARSYQTTANTNLPDTANMISKIIHHPNTTINLNNSSDVVIGPMTQFNERVTIYQYMDATLNHQAKAEIESHNFSKKPAQFSFSLRKNWLNILAVCATVLGLSTTIYFIFYTNNTQVTPPPIVFGRNYDSDTFPNLNGHYIIDREKWGALNHSKLLNLTRLSHPVKYVVVGHMGVQTEPCFNIYTCSVKMRSIQDNAIGNKGLLDVSANFYLGGDGNIYTGRGWDYENSYGDKNLALQFLGDFMRYELEEKQFEAMQFLLNYGKTQKYLSGDYRLFGLNQTRISKYSPGVHVTKRIKNLPRYSFCGEDGFEMCGRDINISWNLKKTPK